VRRDNAVEDFFEPLIVVPDAGNQCLLFRSPGLECRQIGRERSICRLPPYTLQILMMKNIFGRKVADIIRFAAESVCDLSLLTESIELLICDDDRHGDYDQN